MQRQLYFACYDIRCPKRQRKALKLLRGYSSAKQYSCFECFLTANECKILLDDIFAILKQEDAFALIIIPTPNKIICLGQAKPAFDLEFNLLQ